MFWLYLARKVNDMSGFPFALEDVMAPERLQKINSMKNKDAAALSLTAGLLLHRSCKEAGMEGAERRLGYTEKGRPYFLQYPGYYFNISHSGDFACLTFGTENCGVDIERFRPVKESAVKRVFTAEERTWLNGSETAESPGSYEKNVIRLWTRKESYGKYLGEGLSERVRKTSLCPWDERIEDNGTAGDRKVGFLEYGISGYHLSICLSGQKKAAAETPIIITPCISTVKINIE